jgi:hypothetical protein
MDSVTPAMLITLYVRCRVRLHRYRRIRCWVLEGLLGLWSEILPRQPLQLQLPLPASL